jgi:hypothetical protein
MRSSSETACRLLDLASETADTEVADRALRRAWALAAVSATRLRGRAHPLAFVAHLPAGDPALARALADFVPEHGDTLASAWGSAPPLARPPAIGRSTLQFAARIAALGRPGHSAGAALPGARALGLDLLGWDGAALAELARALGRTELAWLCRQLDRRTAIRLLHQLGPERDALARYANATPPLDAASFRAACRRLAVLDFRSMHGGAISAAIGRARLLGLVEGADPATAAALGARFAPALLEATPPDPAWIACTLRLARTVDEGSARGA